MVWVWSLVWEDSTCRRVTKPVSHNYWAHALEPKNPNYWSWVLQLLKPTHWEPMLHNKQAATVRSPGATAQSGPCSPQLEKAACSTRPAQPKINKHLSLKNVKQIAFCWDCFVWFLQLEPLFIMGVKFLPQQINCEGTVMEQHHLQASREREPEQESAREFNPDSPVSKIWTQALTRKSAFLCLHFSTFKWDWMKLVYWVVRRIKQDKCKMHSLMPAIL